MGKRKYTAALILLLSISACGPPKTILSNDQAIMFDHGEWASGFDHTGQIEKSASMAQEHCESYGKNAIPISVGPTRSSYECN